MEALNWIIMSWVTGIYELVTADEEEVLTKQILRSIKATKQSATIRERLGTYSGLRKGSTGSMLIK